MIKKITRSVFVLALAAISASAEVSDPSYFTLDWVNSGSGVEIGTNFTVDIAVDEFGSFSVASSSSHPAGLTFTASGSTILSELLNRQFSLTFGSANGQPYWMHSSAGSYRIGMNGGNNIYRFDGSSEVARITADLSGLDTNLVFNLASFESLNSVSDFVIGVRDSSGTELQGGTNETDVAGIVPQLTGGQSDYFDFRAVSGSAGGCGSFEFAFRSYDIPPPPITLANIFADGCVLQRDQTVPIWGTCEPGVTIVVEVNGQSKQTVTAANGTWRVELDSEPAGGPYTLTVSSGAEDRVPVVLTNVYFGDVWLLTGQSNMENTLVGQMGNYSDYYPPSPNATDDFDDVRFAIITAIEVGAPLDDVSMDQDWTRWQASNLAAMSTVGYYFTRALNEALDANGMDNIPLGIIKVCQGATAAEEWISAEALAAMPETVVQENGKVPSAFYNGMIAPIQDFAFKGALWYQGEGNSRTHNRQLQYTMIKKTLIESWREQWGFDFPFYFVQLAPYMDFVPIPADDDTTGISYENWAWTREAQTDVLAVSNTAMACIIDIGFQNQIHPAHKDIVGQRLANIALADTYGFDLVTRGPTVSDVVFSNSSVTITFDHVANGLQTQAVDAMPDTDEIANGNLPVSVSSNVLAGFALCGADQTFYWATDAEIVSTNQVRISNTVDVPNPVNVRYAWQSFPRCNLFNSAGLPAEPFRTDSYDYGTSGGAELTQPPVSGFFNGTNLTLEWPPMSADWALHSTDSLTNGNWVEVDESRRNTSAEVTLFPGAVNQFFRVQK